MEAPRISLCLFWALLLLITMNRYLSSWWTERPWFIWILCQNLSTVFPVLWQQHKRQNIKAISDRFEYKLYKRWTKPQAMCASLSVCFLFSWVSLSCTQEECSKQTSRRGVWLITIRKHRHRHTTFVLKVCPSTTKHQQQTEETVVVGVHIFVRLQLYHCLTINSISQTWKKKAESWTQFSVKVCKNLPLFRGHCRMWDDMPV